MIRVITLAEFDADTLSLVLKRLQAAYGAGVELARKEDDVPSEALAKGGREADAVVLVREARDVRTFGDDKIVYLTDLPLFLPAGPMGTGPVDGFADVPGVKAVATSHGLGSKGQLSVADGLAKRAARHVGQLFGLHHCYEAKCAMLPGWAEAWSQQAETSLCPFCRDKSEKRIFRV